VGRERRGRGRERGGMGKGEKAGEGEGERRGGTTWLGKEERGEEGKKSEKVLCVDAQNIQCYVKGLLRGTFLEEVEYRISNVV